MLWGAEKFVPAEYWCPYGTMYNVQVGMCVYLHVCVFDFSVGLHVHICVSATTTRMYSVGLELEAMPTF